MMNKTKQLLDAIKKIPYLDNESKSFIDGYLTAKYENWKKQQSKLERI